MAAVSLLQLTTGTHRNLQLPFIAATLLLHAAPPMIVVSKPKVKFWKGRVLALWIY
jgi:hypothetical protein